MNAWTLILAALAWGAMTPVKDSQGNRYQVDEKGAIYTDASSAPLNGRPHASVENIGYYYNKFGSLLGAGHKQDTIFMGTEILDLPEDKKDVLAIKYAVSLSLSRLMEIDDLNRNVPFVRHERKGTVVYRSRQMEFEFRYPSAFAAQDDFAGDPGAMRFAFVGLEVGKPEGKERPATIAVSANRLADSDFEGYVKRMLAKSARERGVILKPVPTPLRAGGRHYRGRRAVDGVAYTEETIFLPHPKGGLAYIVSFRCPDKKLPELRRHFAGVVRELRIGPIPPLSYELKSFPVPAK